jgi:oligopeptide/dipeptide ABC transporter ATP-binding protein
MLTAHRGGGRPEPSEEAGAGDLLEVQDLSVQFNARSTHLSRRRDVVRAVDRVSLSIGYGEIVGLSGESGSGKTTLGRALVRAVAASHGRILFTGEDVTELRGKDLRQLRRRVQVVPQDSFGSLDPTMPLWRSIAEPLRAHKLVTTTGQLKGRVRDLMDMCELPSALWGRRPRELSGGQRQRACIARALSVEPDLIIADEPTSALDVLVGTKILRLLRDLREQSGTSMLLISHNLPALAVVADRVAIMYAGQVVEVGDAGGVLSEPLHPYSRALIEAIPKVDVDSDAAHEQPKLPVRGEAPDPVNLPSGCRFHPRCPLAIDQCARQEQNLEVKPSERWVRCWRV